jgi:hypothetical protein
MQRQKQSGLLVLLLSAVPSSAGLLESGNSAQLLDGAEMRLFCC